MPFDEDFRPILKRNKRKFGEDLGFEKAVNEAVSKGIKPFRERRATKFKRQQSDNDMLFEY